MKQIILLLGIKVMRSTSFCWGMVRTMEGRIVYTRQNCDFFVSLVGESGILMWEVIFEMQPYSELNISFVSAHLKVAMDDKFRPKVIENGENDGWVKLMKKCWNRKQNESPEMNKF
jgi:hypothetical protein